MDLAVSGALGPQLATGAKAIGQLIGKYNPVMGYA